MEFNFSGKSVLVTGSSRGIGKEIAKQFIDNDAEVVLNGINSENLNKVTHEFKIEKKLAGNLNRKNDIWYISGNFKLVPSDFGIELPSFLSVKMKNLLDIDYSIALK